MTGKTISSYKTLMNNPATAEVWQTAFGKDFGGIAQGCNKMGQKGTNAMFVMTKAEIARALTAGKKITYANSVIESELSVRTADIITENCIGTVW